MRSLQAATAAWDELKHYKSLTELKEATRIDGHSSAVQSAGLRSACWKAFLLFESVDTAQWPKNLAASRSAYNSLRMHFLRYLENREELEGEFDPLAEQDESSPWAVLKKDEELRQEIQQDVDRCMPENLYFRQSETQRMLLDILFVWCKLNPDVGYRQGMHELLAPILWVVECDAIDLGPSSKALGEDATVRAIFDGEHIEHDSFALFSQLMQGAKAFYEQTTHHGKENPIVLRSQRITGELLTQIDPELAQHLQKIDIVPQVFLMRWIRLLFGREFARFDDVLALWDVIFAEDTTLDIVEYICLAMLLRIRWELLDADYNGALTLLLRYPEPDRECPPQTLALDDLYLHDHLNTDGSGYLVLKYTGRPLVPRDRPTTPPALQRNITHFSGIPSLGSPSQQPRHGGQRANLEAMLQSTARGVLARGKSALNEVHKRAQEIRDAQTPSVPARSAPRPGALAARVRALDERNKQLAKLLEGAVGQLWEYQKTASDLRGTSEGSVSEGTGSSEKAADLEKLSLAVAKVQFVQVYLEDASLPLPAEETGHQQEGEKEKETEPARSEESGITGTGTLIQASPPAQSGAAAATSYDEKLADPSMFEDDDDQAEPCTPPVKQLPSTVPSINIEESTTTDEVYPPSTAVAHAAQDPQPTATISPLPPANAATESSPPTVTSPPRPTLAESNYSWMLGEEDGQTPAKHPFNRATSVLPEQGRSKGFLFGDGEGGGRVGSPSRKERPKKQKAQLVKQGSGEKRGEDDMFDLGTLKKTRPPHSGGDAAV